MTIIDTETIIEDDAIRLYYELSRKFGWQGTFFTRGDAKDSWENYHEQTKPFTDEVWETVRQSYYWRRALPDNLTADGLSIVNDAVSEAIHPVSA